MTSTIRIVWMLLSAALVATSPLQAATPSSPESEYYPIVTIPIPQGIALEAGGMQFLPNGQLAVCTRFGEIYL